MVTYEEIASSNGADVNEFILELGTSSSFQEKYDFIQNVTNRFQRITTSAYSLPWNLSSTFTLSLMDFHGEFENSLGFGCMVRIEENS